MNKTIKTNKGITIVTLVITIIVLLILAGVSIGLIFNSDGLLKKSSSSASRYNQKQAEEILEMTLKEAQIMKYEKEGLTDEKLDQMINKIGKVDEKNNSIVTVNSYIFEIDRTVPKIGSYKGVVDKVESGNEGDNGGDTENNELSNKITITLPLPIDEMTLKFGITELSNNLNINQYNYTIQPTDGIPSDKIKGTFAKEDVVKIITTKEETYTITVTGTNNTGDIIAKESVKMKTKDTLPVKGAEPPSGGWTIEVAKRLVERDGLKAHLGEEVVYNPVARGTWRIFYYDTEDDGSGNGYFGPTNTLYLKRDFVDCDTTLSTHKDHESSDNGEIMKKMNPMWANSSYNIIDKEAEYYVSWFCDPAQWLDYKVDGVANYAIGSPSVEMYMKAYNIFKENEIELTCKIETDNKYYDGYSVGINGEYTQYKTIAGGSIESGPNEIFLKKSSSAPWWIASPSATTAYGTYGRVLFVDHTGQMDARHKSSKFGTCPVAQICK